MPNAFVLKTNHDCGGVVIVEDKEAFLNDKTRLKNALKKLESHRQTNYYPATREWHYKDIEARIFAEELLGEHLNGGWKVPEDYKFHCFSKGLYIQVDTDRFTNHTRTIFDEKWTEMPIEYLYSRPNQTPTKPSNLATMLGIAKALSVPFKMIRVDLYSINNQVIVGELTFTAEGGTGRFTPPEYDRILGDLWGNP